MAFSADDLRQLARLFDELWDVPDSARQAWIDRLAPQFAHLRDALRDWCRQRAAGEGHFDTLAKFTAQLDAAGEGDAGGLVAGAQVAGYRLIREVGRGGMSTVWLAQRVDGELKRDVVLKLPFRHLHLPEFAERFSRERDILAGLTHPHIARLYDAGVSAEGQPYLVMEYVDGTPLTAHCDAGELSIEKRLALFEQVLDAVRYAHSRLVLHRDLKPSNILVDRDGRVMLLDFGIARLAVDAAGNAAEVTQMGSRAMTPAYASPEQLSGLALTTASDVYSLGVILFELLAGERPYRTRSASAAALEEAILSADAPRLAMAVTETQPTRTATPRVTLLKSLRGDLDAIVHKALQKSPARRYSSVEQFAQDLRAFGAGEPVTARPDSRAYVLGKFLRRHKAAVGGTAAALVAIIVGAIVAGIAAHVAIEQRDRALALASRNRAVTEFLGVLIEESAESGKPLTVKEMLERSELLATTEKHVNPDHRAAVLQLLAEQYHTLDLDAKAEQVIESALPLVRDGPDRELYASVRCTQAMSMGGMGDRAHARRIVDEVLASKAAGTQETARCLLIGAYIAQDARDGDTALRLSLEALTLLRTLPERSASAEATYVTAVASGYQLKQRYVEADGYFRDALQRYEELGRGASADAISARNDWGSMLNEAGNPLRAGKVFDDTLDAMARHNSGTEPPGYLLANRAKSFEMMGEFEQAIGFNERCAAGARRASNVAAFVYCTVGLATDVLEQGEFDRTQHHLDEAAKMRNSRPDTLAANVEFQRLVEAHLAYKRGTFAESHRLYDAILDTYGAKRPVPSALRGRALVSLREGKLDDAMRDALTTLKSEQKEQGVFAHSSFVGRSWLLIAQIRLAQGDREGSRAAARAAAEQFSDTVDPTSLYVRAAGQLADSDAEGLPEPI